MSVLNYAWLSSDTSTQLFSLFCNYCSLGQYELARASLVHFAAIDKKEALSSLNQLIHSSTPKSWLTSKTVPSRAHLMWLCLTDYKRFHDAQSWAAVDIPQSVWNQVEASLLLECINNQTIQLGSLHKPHISKLLSRGSMRTQSSPSPLLSVSTLDGLKTALLTFPLIGSFLSAHFKQMQRIIVNSCYIDIISELLDNRHVEEAIFFFRCLNLDTTIWNSEKELRGALETVFRKFWGIVEREEGEHVGWCRQGYSALLSPLDEKNSALFYLLNVEDDQIRRLCVDDGDTDDAPLPWSFRVFPETTGTNIPESPRGGNIPETPAEEETNSQFWNRYYHFIRVTTRHGLEFVVERCSKHLSRREWVSCSTLVRPFPELKPLLLLMTWHQFRQDVAAQTALVKLLWGHALVMSTETGGTEEERNSVKVDPALRSKCDEIAYQISLTWWCVGKLKVRNVKLNDVVLPSMKIGKNTFPVVGSITSVSSEENDIMLQIDSRERVQSAASLIFALLQDASLVYVMQAYLHLVPSRQIIRIININPKASKTASRVVDAIGKDLRLIHSYYALQHVMEILNEAAMENAELEFVSRKLYKVERHLMAVVTMPGSMDVVMVLLQTIFSLLFVKSSAFTESNSSDITLTAIVLRSKSAGKETVDGFTVTRPIAEWIINLLKKLVVDPLSTHPSASKTDSLFYKQLTAFKTLLMEAIWRLSLLKRLPAGEGPTFWNVMLATPETLLVMCVRMKNWKCANEVIDFFKMDKPHVELVNRAVAFYNVRQKIEEEEEAAEEDEEEEMLSIETMVPDIDISSDLAKFLVCMDIAVAVAPTTEQCTRFLNFANSFLEDFPAFTSAVLSAYYYREDEVPHPAVVYYPSVLKQYHTRMMQLIKDKDVASSGLSVRHLLTRLEAFPTSTPLALSQYIAMRSALGRVKQQLQKEIQKHNLVTEGDTTDVMLLNLLASLPSEDTPSPSEEATDTITPNAPLVQFLRYLYDLGFFLIVDPNQGTPSYFYHLDQSPSAILSSLVFISKDHAGAEKLSRRLGLDLVPTILDRLNADRTDTTSRHGPVPSPTPSVRRASRSFRETVHSATPLPSRYPLTMSEVRYIGSRNPLLAVLACILRSPLSQFEGDILSYALSQSVQFPVLHRWVVSRARVYSLFQEAFLDKRLDNILINLDPKLSVADLGRQSHKWRAQQTPQGNGGSTPKELRRSTEVTRQTFFPISEVIPDNDQFFYGLIFQEEPIKGENQFFEKVVGKAALAGENFVAAELADMTLVNGAQDALFPKILEKCEDKSITWRYVLRISDKLEQAKLVLHYVSHWELSKAQDLLHMSSCHLRKILGPIQFDSRVRRPENNHLPGLSDLEPSFRSSLASHYRTLGTASYDEYLDVLEEVEKLEANLKIYKELLDAVPGPWTSWNEVDKLVQNNPRELVDKLVVLEQYKLAREIAAQCRLPPTVTLLIEEKYLLTLLRGTATTTPTTTVTTEGDVSSKNFVTVHRHLVKLGGTEAVVIAQKLLEKVNTNTARLFLVQFLRENHWRDEGEVVLIPPAAVAPPTMSMSVVDYRTQEQGIRILLLLPSELQQVYEELRCFPALILESLVMSERITLVSEIIKTLPDLRNESMFVKYAIKAIWNPTSSSEEDDSDPVPDKMSAVATGEGGTDPPRLLWVLRENGASKVRRKHFYKNIPRHQLAIDLLDLCEDSQLAGQTCLGLCDTLSEEMNTNDSKGNRLFIVYIIQQLLYYGKLRLANNTEYTYSTHGVQDCDIFLARVELLQQLLLSNVDLGGQRISLSTFSDTQKACQLRDKLIIQDRLELAIDVANKCNIDSVPAWAQWGITLLKLAKYNEAKEKFQYCLIPTMKDDEENQEERQSRLLRQSTSSRRSSNTEASLTNKTILNSIISILESGPPSKQFELRARYHELKKNLPKLRANARSANPSMDMESYFRALQLKAPPELSINLPLSPRSPKAVIPRGGLTKQHSLDTVRYMQCIYYLQLYGAPEDLIEFWLRHHLIEDALRYILNAQLDNNVFLSVVNYVLADNLLAKFLEALLKVDPTQKKWHPFLIHTCKHFKAHKMFDLLLEFQVFMKDYVSAGLNCIQIFTISDDYQDQLQLLDTAKDYFLKGSIQDTSGMIGWNPDDEKQATLLADVNKYTRSINLQKETINFFYAHQKKTGAKLEAIMDSTLFGPPEKRVKIAEMLLELSNFDLAWKIIQEYQLETARIYQSAFTSLAHKKQTSSISTILKNIRGMIDDNDWDDLVLGVIKVYSNELHDRKTAESFLGQVRKPVTKIKALIACRKLKQAYLEAVKLDSHALVKEIYAEAKKHDMTQDAELCAKYLTQHKNTDTYLVN